MIAQLETENVDETIDTVLLEADRKGTAANEFEAKLSSRIVGQERAVRQTSDLYQVFLAGMNPPNQPVGTMLFLGPTGSGKTRVVEAAAEVLFGDPNAVVKIDCAEFQHSHEIAKLSMTLGNRADSAQMKSFKIYPTQRLLANQRMNSVGDFLGTFSGTRGIQGTEGMNSDSVKPLSFQ
jgi:AAA domain (Cdc48 subfamily)